MGNAEIIRWDADIDTKDADIRMISISSPDFSQKISEQLKIMSLVFDDWRISPLTSRLACSSQLLY